MELERKGRKNESLVQKIAAMQKEMQRMANNVAALDLEKEQLKSTARPHGEDLPDNEEQRKTTDAIKELLSARDKYVGSGIEGWADEILQ